MINVLIDACCRACGYDETAADAGTGGCGRCGTPNDVPQTEPARVGRVVEIGGLLRTTRGVALSEAGGKVALLTKGETPASLSTEEFDRLRIMAVPGPAVIGPAGRLWAALAALRAGAVSAKWRPELVEQAAASCAQATLGARRAAAIDALALGLQGAVPGLNLPTSEVLWYAAYHASVAGRTGDLLNLLEQLPGDSYSGRTTLLLARFEDLSANPGFASRAADQLRPFADRVLDARALLTVLRGAPALDALDFDLVTQYADTVAENSGAEAETLRATASRVTGTGDRTGPRPTSTTPAVRALFAFDDGCAGAALDGRVAELAALPLALVDELIDGAALTPAAASDPAWPREYAAYVRCRLDPGAASDADLAACAFDAETARRWFIADARMALASLDGDDARVRHYQALASWLAGTQPGEPELDGLDPAGLEAVEQFDQLRRELAQVDGPRQLPDAVAADPTLWRLLEKEAAAGRLELAPESSRRYQRCADWLDLHLVRRLLFEGLWNAAAEEAEALAHRAGTAETRAEAYSMVGCARAQLGRTDLAYRAADEAVREIHTTGLLVNAGLTAATALGPLAGIPYFGFVAAEDDDPAVRDNAARHVLAEWYDAAGPEVEYPETMQVFVRSELAAAHSGDVKLALLRAAVNWDAPWLASTGAVRTDGDEQAAQLRYFRTLARSRTDGYTETSRDVAAALGRLAKQPNPEAWVARELKGFTDAVGETLFGDFGEAAGVVPAVVELLDQAALEPLPRVVFGARAAAHLAAADEGRGRGFGPNEELRLLFQPCAAFLAPGSDVPDGARETVAEQLAICLRVASAHVSIALSNVWDEASDQWNALVRQRQYAYDQVRQIAAKQSAVLKRLQAHVDRLERYRRLLSALPPEEGEIPAKWRNQLAETIHERSAEIDRLRNFI